MDVENPEDYGRGQRVNPRDYERIGDPDNYDRRHRRPRVDVTIGGDCYGSGDYSCGSRSRSPYYDPYGRQYSGVGHLGGRDYYDSDYGQRRRQSGPQVYQNGDGWDYDYQRFGRRRRGVWDNPEYDYEQQQRRQEEWNRRQQRDSVDNRRTDDQYWMGHSRTGRDEYYDRQRNRDDYYYGRDQDDYYYGRNDDYYYGRNSRYRYGDGAFGGIGPDGQPYGGFSKDGFSIYYRNGHLGVGINNGSIYGRHRYPMDERIPYPYDWDQDGIWPRGRHGDWDNWDYESGGWNYNHGRNRHGRNGNWDYRNGNGNWDYRNGGWDYRNGRNGNWDYRNGGVWDTPRYPWDERIPVYGNPRRHHQNGIGVNIPIGGDNWGANLGLYYQNGHLYSNSGGVRAIIRY